MDPQNPQTVNWDEPSKIAEEIKSSIKPTLSPVLATHPITTTKTPTTITTTTPIPPSTPPSTDTFTLPKNSVIGPATTKIDYVKYDPNRPQSAKDTRHSTTTTLAITMIVLNETKVLPRLLDSIVAFLDYWVIVDTGSTDGTQDLILKYFTEKNVPGELHHIPWKNFGYNRTKAIQATQNKADYTFLVDADFIVNVKDPNFKNVLSKVGADGHLIKYEGGLDYRQNLLVRTACNWYYKGVTHEFVSAPDGKRMAQYDGVTITHKADGGSRSNKFERDIQLLEDGLKEEPDNGRYLFYLGQSYKDLGGTLKNKMEYQKRLIVEFKKKIANPGNLTEDQIAKISDQVTKFEHENPELEKQYIMYLEKSIPTYYKRARIGGWGEEVYFAYLQIGLAKMRKGDNFWDFMADFLHAYMFRSNRLEALFHLIRYCRLHNMSHLGYHLGKLAEKNKYPTDYLFIDRGIHEWGFWDELALCSHNVGDYELAYELGKRIIGEKKYPDRDKARIERNFAYFKDRYNKATQAKQTQEKSLAKSIPEGETVTPAVIVDASGPASTPLDASDVVPPVAPAPSSYQFIRIKPEVKENRVAMIIPNYNMPERAGLLAEYIRDHVTWPTDVILVDNGSNQAPPSKYTALHLTSNVQTTHGWLMGLHYADSLETFENFKYLAYNFVITSTEILDVEGDFIEKLVQPMLDDSEVVGVHPSLSTDSTTWWKHMINRPTSKTDSPLRYTNMIDNICSLYRADWFNSVGRFEPSLTYAWGIDMETSYYARRDGKKIILHDGVQVRKITDIGYKMDRMGMTGEDRFKNAKEQIDVYFTKKYGDNTVSRAHRVPEFLRVDTSIDQIMQSFTPKEGGHALLMEFIWNHPVYQPINPKKTSQTVNMIEIGTNREEWSHLNSTYKLSQLAKAYGYHFWTVDPNTDSVNNAKRMISYDHFHPVNQRAEDFLSSYKGSIDLVYLDGFDINLSANHHSQARRDDYRKYLKTEIENQKCYQMHLDSVRLVDQRLKVGGLICINDVINSIDFQYKGRTAVPYLLRTGKYRIMETKYNAVILEKISEQPSPKLVAPIPVPNNDPKQKYIVTLLGYTNSQAKHTNWFPWNRFLDVYKTMGYRAEWCELDSLKQRISEPNPTPRIFICWNAPTCVELAKTGVLHKTDVVIQKLTSLGKGMEQVNWGNNPKEFFKTWHWPLYQTVEKLLESGFNIYAFGCKTRNTQDFPEKDRIVKKLEKLNRVFWINWGSTVFNYEEIQNCKPTPTDQFEYDMGYVGSKWGRAGRGNLDQWNNFIQPVLDQATTTDLKTGFYGGGFPKGMISDEDAKVVLRKSKICPILHAPSWVAEEGIQDRFYTVFTAGRFGIVDNPGIYEFFEKDEVICETDPIKYQELTKYYMEHPEQQVPFIEKVQHKIRTKYNLYTQWDNILTQILTDQLKYQSDDYQFLSNVSQAHAIKEPFYSRAIKQ